MSILWLVKTAKKDFVMTDIVLSKLEEIVRKSKSIAQYSSAKADAARMAYDYVHNFSKIEDDARTRALFANVILLMDSESLKRDALDRLESEYPEMSIKRAKKSLNTRIRAQRIDEIENNFCRTTLEIFRDMSRIKKFEYEQYKDQDIKEIRKFLASLPDMTQKQEMKFAELFVKKNQDSIDSIPPIILANAYKSLRAKVNSGVRGTAEDLFNVVLVRIDDLAQHFSVFDGKSVTFEGEIKDDVHNFVDVTNVANTAEGYRKMFVARAQDFPGDAPGVFGNELRNSIEKLDNVIKEYDDAWNLHNVADENTTEERLDALDSIVSEFDLPDDIKRKLSNYKFFDAANNQIPQFVDADGNQKTEYDAGDGIITDSRLAQIIDLARSDVIMRHVANSKEKEIHEEDLEKEFFNRVLFKLFEIDTAAKNYQGITEHPENFRKPEYFEDFKNILGFSNMSISDLAYKAAMKSQVDQTLGFVGRLQEKLKPVSNRKRGNLFEKLLKPLDKIDENKDARLGDKGALSKQKIEFFKNIFKTFGNGFLVSAGLSAVAGAAVLLTGIGPKVAIATVSIAAGISIAALQIRNWQKTHSPNNVDALLADQQMLIKLGVTGIAAIAMIFGAVGLAKVGAILGYTSLGAGTVNNAVQIFKAAKSQGFGIGKSIAFALGSVIAGATGAFLGRAAVMSGVNALYKPENLSDNMVAARTENNHNDVVAAKSESIAEPAEETVMIPDNKPVSHFETQVFTSQDAIDNAKRITELFYQDDLAKLQRQVDLINDYNQTYGTNVDPYRAIMFSADAGAKVPSNYAIQINDAGDIRYTNGIVKVFGAGWLKSHPEFSVDDINQMKNLFSADGKTVNPAAMDVAGRLNSVISPNNEVGAVQSGDHPLYNSHLMKNYTDANGNKAFNTFVDGASSIETKQVEVFNKVETPVAEPKPVVEEPAPVVEKTEPVAPLYQPMGMVGMVGMNGPKILGKFRQFKKRMGTFFDTVLQR